MLKIRKDQQEALGQRGVGRVQACPARQGEIETRKITLAQGIQFNNWNMMAWPWMCQPWGLVAPKASRTPDWPVSHRSRGPLDIVTKDADHFEYTSKVQGVKFEVEIVKTRYEFRHALMTPDRHVVYAGHARYGRGPCFGVSDAPGENWEDGVDPPWGIFRMGYPFIGIPIHEIQEHQYTVDLTSSSVTVTEDQSEPDLRKFIPALQAKTAADIHPDLPKYAKDKDPTKTWWTYMDQTDLDEYERHTGKYRPEPHVVVNAGWKDTTTRPEDIGSIAMACRVFCHFGCDTLKHNHAIIRSKSFKGWQQNGDDRFAFFTTAVSGSSDVHWLYHLFTYPVYNAFCAWEPSLRYAVAKTNADLATDNEKYRIA